jgi:hypothetical protein
MTGAAGVPAGTTLRAAGRPVATGLDPEPRRILEAGLSVSLGRPARIERVESKPAIASTHALDRLRVTLDSGEQLRVVFKRPQPGEKLYGNEREVLVYQELLGGRRFGAPELYASVYDPARDRYWLFIEDLGSWTLDLGDTEEWLAAAELLAEMHGTYLGREDDLRALGCLGEHDWEYYEWIGATARRTVERTSTLEALTRFDRLMERYESLVEYLLRRPRTLLHADIATHNILVESGPRIRPIDWESAAIGPPEYDLVRLLDGWEPSRTRARLVGAYFSALSRHSGGEGGRPSFERGMRCCEIVLLLRHLRWSFEPHYADTAVEDLLDEIEAAWGRLDAEGGHG